jgi:putative tryptophan/tyrosine transport system substrate-binding protein
MKRRNFIAVLAGAATFHPIASPAQLSPRSAALVGVVWIGAASAQISVRVREAFLRGLRENGYVEGRNIAIEDRYFGNSLEQLNAAIAEFVRIGVDVIVATGTTAALAASRATITIPIVVAAMADPVADGLIASLARPGRNVTGNTFIGPELGPKRLQLLKEAFPEATRFGVLQHPHVYSESTMQQMLSEIQRTARELEIDVHVFDANRPEDFDGAFEAMAERRTEALLLFPSPMFYVNYRHIVDHAERRQLPTMYYFREAVEGGGFMCYGADLPNLALQAARYVVKILRGTKPGDLPVEQPTKFEFVINLKTSKTLGVVVPATMIAQADEVIE